MSGVSATSLCESDHAVFLISQEKVALNTFTHTYTFLAGVECQVYLELGAGQRAGATTQRCQGVWALLLTRDTVYADQRRRRKALITADRGVEEFFILILPSVFCKQKMRRKNEKGGGRSRGGLVVVVVVGGSSIVIAGSERSLPFRIKKELPIK